jgi:hypothetical protein
VAVLQPKNKMPAYRAIVQTVKKPVYPAFLLFAQNTLKIKFGKT